AIAEKAEQEDLRADFDAIAEDRYASIVASGKTISWEQVRGYLQDRVAGKVVKRSAARKLARCKCRALNWRLRREMILIEYSITWSCIRLKIRHCAFKRSLRRSMCWSTIP